MSPKKLSKKAIVLSPIEIVGSEETTTSSIYDFNSSETETIEKYTKSTAGGSLVSICL